MEINVHSATKTYGRKSIPYSRYPDERNNIHVSFVVLVEERVQREARAGAGAGTVQDLRQSQSNYVPVFRPMSCFSGVICGEPAQFYGSKAS
jgi:hypothetical protein